MRAHSQFPGEFAVAQDFYSVETGGTIGQPGAAESQFVHARPFLKAVQRLQVDGQEPGRMPGVVKAAFRDAAYQRHLPAFKADAD